MINNDIDNNKKDIWTKIMFGVLVFFGISTLILGILKISTTISSTELYNQAENEPINSSAGIDNMQKSIEELQASDTDGDGLSDFDELYVYNTSMYLADTDSDGYDDKSEIDGGYDPNCPKGLDCRGTSSSVDETTDQTADQTTDQTTDETTGQTTDQTTDMSQLPTETKEQLENLTPDEIRQLLLATGQINQEDLDKIDDATLMQVMEEILNQ
jgi:hypothetical protein